MAAAAREFGLNDNLVHQWRRGRELGVPQAAAQFIALPLPAPYLRMHVTLLKCVGAMAPQEVRSIGGNICIINGVPSAAVLPADWLGRPLSSRPQRHQLAGLNLSFRRS